MNRVLITYRAASGIKGHIIVPTAYSDKAIGFVTYNLKAKVVEVREPHATQGLIIPKGWDLSEEVQRYWNIVELVNN
jgi:hypothetical protein